MTKARIAKQKRREQMVARRYAQRQELKKIVRDLTRPMEERLEAQDQLNKLPKNSSPVRLRNRCQLTGRPRGNLRKFKMSRICFRQLANSGHIPGVFKASW